MVGMDDDPTEALDDGLAEDADTFPFLMFLALVENYHAQYFSIT